MSFTPVGTIGSATAKTFTLTPSGTGHFILLWVTSETAADFATAAVSTNINSGAGWTVLVAHHAFTNPTSQPVVQTVFIGQVTSTSGATVTVTTAGSPTLRIAWQEFSNTLGYAAVTLDASGLVDTASSGTMPSVTPTRANDLYCGYVFDSSSGSAGSTSGYTYQLDTNTNQMAYRASCANAVQTPNIGDSNGTSGIGVMLYEAVTSFPSAAALSGTGSLTAARLVTQPAAASLSGSGTVTAAGTASTLASAALIGLGTVTAGATVTVIGQGAAALSGSGSLGVTRAVTWQAAAPLSGSGALAAQETGISQESAAFSGSGTLSVAAAAALKFTAGLFGAGFLSIPQVAGGLVNGVGGAGTPQALPGSSQVAVAPPGSGNWQWLGTLGQVTALTYSYTCPGGADKMTCAVLVPASYRTQLFNPGWQVKITRGGMDIWHGKLDEPQPSPSGWTLTAVGNGNRGTDFLAVYSGTWPAGQPDAAVNGAITRGLPWANPGIGSPAGIWLGQSVDSGAQTITALLNLVTSRGGLTWYVNSQPGGLYGGDDLSVFPLPTVPNRLLVATTPVARTLGGDVNTIYIRFQASADNSAATPPVAATYSTVTAVNAQSVAAHGPLEVFLDIADAGTLTSAAAQAVGSAALQLYTRASFAGPFQASYGQLLNTGGAAIDPGCDQAGTMVRMLLYDYGLGGEVAPGPITWIVGSYSWDDFKMVATLTPTSVLDQSLSGLLSAGHSALMPVTVAAA